MNIMFVLLPLAMLVILLAMGALFWVSKVRATNAAVAQHNEHEQRSTDSQAPDSPSQQ
ncbi:hypothetical protein L9G74_11525 [Shewanella sp. C32]|uniref:Uncharacterized protein n=1 Tax=Shewanella electrica TaxID=515560 RepID=A0ABT2FPD5_9GAMM|nr:hypothetical protein [Shewanella electrica]MCH1923855.1 hypothetical protein [Shewanella electrica]MCS4557074.1 hypothetical protein [Shewanella electrica]